MSSLTSHSRRATLRYSESKTSSSKRRVKMLSREMIPYQLRLESREVPRERERPFLSQLPETRRLLQPRRLMLAPARVLTRSSSIPQTSPQAERKLPRNQLQFHPLLLLQPRSQPLEVRSKPRHCHHQVASSPQRPWMRCQWPSSRDTSTGTRTSLAASQLQAAKFWEREAQARPQLPQARLQRHPRDPRSDIDCYNLRQFSLNIKLITLFYC